MPKKLKNKKITCRYFTWRVGTRDNGMYYADERMKGKQPDLGRQSLGTRVYEEAMDNLQKLDLAMAVKHGRADRSLLAVPKTKALPLADGAKLYLDHVNRPKIAGGSPKAAKRYRPIFAKFTKFLNGAGVDAWQQVDKRQLDKYAGWLDEESYAYRTEYTELTTIKQALKYLVEQHLLSESALFKYPLKKPNGTTTYCYSTEQVAAMMDHCERRPDLQWLVPVLIGLAHTGLRISELADLRWHDLDDDWKSLRLLDHSRQGTETQRATARTTKGQRDRVLPIHARLKQALQNLARHPDGLIFHGPRKGRLKPGTVRNVMISDVLKPLAQRFPRVGDEPAFEDGRVHSFRHYFCSVCANSNVPELMLMAWLGHRNSDMVKHYYHGDPQMAAQMMNQINILGEDDAT